MQILAKLLLAAALFFTALLPALAGPYEDGLAAYEQKDYNLALQIWKPLADQGDAEAQSDIGLMYKDGRGVPQSDQQAVNWFRKAADQGIAAAQFNLGLMYEYGRGVTQSDQQAANWFRKAADQGHAKAQFSLGLMYADGRGVPQSNQQAVSWYRKSEDQGYAGAQYNLGLMYKDGRGVPQSDQQAANWFRKAADQGIAAAQYNLGLMYYYGRGVTQSTKTAIEWITKAAGQGHKGAKSALKQLGAPAIAETEAKERFPLVEASATGTLKDVETLLLDPAIRQNIDAAGTSSETALTEASRRGRADVVRALLDAGADIHGETDSEYPMFAFHIATLEEHLDVMDVFVERGFGVDDANEVGTTALILAVGNDKVKSIIWLLERGASIEKENSWNKSPLSIAKFREKPEVLPLLLKEMELRESRRLESENVVTEAYAVIPGKAVQDVGALRLPGSASNDEQALTFLCSYVVGETTFGDFQRAFSRYFTRQTATDPNSAPGQWLKPLHSEWTAGVPPEKSHLLAASMNRRMLNNSELIPEELIPYVSGTYVFGHIKSDQAPATYKSSPSSFNVYARLFFTDGVLAKLHLLSCKE